MTEESLVKVIQQVYARLGLRITKAKLAQTVPAAGVVISVGMNMAPVQAVARDAALASRLRFLSVTSTDLILSRSFRMLDVAPAVPTSSGATSSP